MNPVRQEGAGYQTCMQPGEKIFQMEKLNSSAPAYALLAGQEESASITTRPLSATLADVGTDADLALVASIFSGFQYVFTNVLQNKTGEMRYTNSVAF